MQLVPGDSAGEPADVDGDRDVDLLERPPEPDHVPPDQPHPRQERQRPHAHDRSQVLHTGTTAGHDSTDNLDLLSSVW